MEVKGLAMGLQLGASLSVLLLLGACADAGARETPVPLSSPIAMADANKPTISFQEWVKGFRVEALKAGISADVFDRAFRGVTPDPEVVAADQSQPEFTKAVWEYLGSALSDKRVATGKQLIAERKALLDRIEQTYGVPRETVVAIWGLESGYGQFQGSMNVVRSLATIAYEGRRPEFGRSQLIAALKIIQAGDIAPDAMLGSWAGAMGQTQFIPTTYQIHAVDFDGDKRRDIWNSVPDALGSTAQYISHSGWKSDEVWGGEVRLPKDFDYAQADMSVKQPISYWAAKGVVPAAGGKFPAREYPLEASILLPAGYRGPAFIVTENFRAVLAYNASTSYALAVCLLSDRFNDRGTLMADWPLSERPLARAERVELQRLLTEAGFDTGGIDGIIGYNSRKAIRAYQVKHKLPADGYPTASLLARLQSQ
ncbi:MAG: lytic murein transglycosylase [Rhizobiales bacterium]|nr:lytic murein transglycosylase [Hyphomicrobiales bacterium]